MSASLEPLAQHIEARLGLHFPPARHADLTRGLDRAARELGLPSWEACAEAILAGRLDADQFDTITAALTIGETYFLRHAEAFATLEKDLLPALVRTREATTRHLRLWSAACCTGEEAYSLAITVDRVLSGRRGWNVTVLGTDINPVFLERARRGRYRPWSFRSAPDWLQRDYFRPLGGDSFELDRRIREMVTFAALNLAEDAYPSPLTNTNAMDIIFCRNVLIYFEASRARSVVDRLQRALLAGGDLFLGPAETTQGLLHAFEPRARPGVVYHHKPDTAAVAASGPAAREPRLASPAPPRSRAQTPRRQSASMPPDRPAVADRVAPAPLPAPVDPEPLLEARRLADAGELDAALVAVTGVVERDRTRFSAYLLRATVLQELGRWAQAYEDLKRCVYLQPDHPLACFLCGRAASRTGDRGRVPGLLRTAARLLAPLDDEACLDDSDGMSAGQLKRMLATASAGVDAEAEP